jgi:hypothetical protein
VLCKARHLVAVKATLLLRWGGVLEDLSVRIKDSDSALDLAYDRHARAGVPVSITTTSININTSCSVASADIWVYLRSAWSWCIYFVRSSKLGRTYFSMSFRNTFIEPRGHITPILFVHSIIIRLLSHRILRSSCVMFEVSKQKVLSCAMDTAMCGLLYSELFCCRTI